MDAYGHSKEISSFDMEYIRGMGLLVKDVIAPSSIRIFPRYMLHGDTYVCAMRIDHYPSSLSDEFFVELTDVPFNMISTMNIQPIPMREANQIVRKNIMLARNEKIEERRALLNANLPEDMISLDTEEKLQIEVYFIKTPMLPTITVLPTSPPTFISPSSHPIITTRPTEIPILLINTPIPEPTISQPVIITTPISTNPSLPLPTSIAESEELPKPIINGIPIMIGTSASSFGGMGLLLFFLLRKRRTWHGVFTEDMLPYMKIKGIADSETRENWCLPELANRFSNNEITIEEYIETVLHCGVITILPSDAKMTIIIGEEIRIFPAIEHRFFSILKETHTDVSFTLTSAKSGVKISIEYNKRVIE